MYLLNTLFVHGINLTLIFIFRYFIESYKKSLFKGSYLLSPYGGKPTQLNLNGCVSQ
uniref:Uncharacterized protein n=1 Tax=Sphingobacterium sp. (strain 21) TaxID=743722 RepID=F4C3Z6_SPHS2